MRLPVRRGADVCPGWKRGQPEGVAERVGEALSLRTARLDFRARLAERKRWMWSHVNRRRWMQVAARLGAACANAQQLKIASPQRGSWEGAVPELGREQGIFKKHGLDLEILYTAGGGETLQTVVSGAVDIGLS